MKLIMTIFFTLILALPALAADPPAADPSTQTGQAKTPQGGDPCDDDRVGKGEGDGDNVNPPKGGAPGTVN